MFTTITFTKRTIFIAFATTVSKPFTTKIIILQPLTLPPHSVRTNTYSELTKIIPIPVLSLKIAADLAVLSIPLPFLFEVSPSREVRAIAVRIALFLEVHRSQTASG